MSFAGFTNDVPSPTPNPQKLQKKKVVKKSEKLLMAAADKKTREIVGGTELLPPEAKLSAPSASPVKLLIKDDGKCQLVSGEDPPQAIGDSGKEDIKSANKTIEEKIDNISESIKSDENANSTNIAPRDKLEIFQEKQKIIEEQNRKRKEMLAKVISERQKKTATETRKLEIVQHELQKIDLLLNTDVQYLRDSIEQASYEFMRAQKRYDDAEKEFVDAKMNLYGVMERKELLTDHLCSIIEQNEMRKAKRLNELMEELELEGVKIETEEKGDISLTDLRQPTEINTLKRSESLPVPSEENLVED